MIFKQRSQNWRPFAALTVLLLVSLACGTSSNGEVPTIDPGLVQTAIMGTAAAAQLQTLDASIPEQTSTPLPTLIIASTEALIPTLDATTLPVVITGALIRIKDVDKVAEYVDLENVGDQLQDFTGWSLVSERGNQSCSLSGVITSGEILRVWANNPDGGGFNCNFGSEIWNNSESDPAVLYNDQGQEVARYP